MSFLRLIHNPMESVTLIKIGGSVITDKKRPYTARKDIIRNLAKEIKKIKTPVVLSHGVGSFAHTSAAKYGGKKGYTSTIGIATVAFDVLKINTIVMDILLQEGIPAVSVRPMSMFYSEEGKLKQHNLALIPEILQQHLIPVVSGDVILDKKWNSTIYSGETTLNKIALYLKHKGISVKKIIQVMNENGLYDHQKQTIPTLTVKEWKTAEQCIEHPLYADVTGGMKHKVEDALRMTQYGFQTWLVNGNTPAELLLACQGQFIHGTIIR